MTSHQYTESLCFSYHTAIQVFHNVLNTSLYRMPAVFLTSYGCSITVLFQKWKRLHQILLCSIAEKCFDFSCILKMATVKSVQHGNNFFMINHIISCGYKFYHWDTLLWLLLGHWEFICSLCLSPSQWFPTPPPPQTVQNNKSP